MDKIKISPRAKRLAEEGGIDICALAIDGRGVSMTGWDGGISSRDVADFIARGGGGVSAPATGANVSATPLAKKIAEVENIDLNILSGTGPNGKVTKADVLSSNVKTPVKEAGIDNSAAAEDLGFNGDKKIAKVSKYAGVRKIIGDRLAESKFTAPHLYFTQAVDLSELLPLRKMVNEKQEKKTSVTDYIARAAVIALQKYPEINSSLVGESIEEYASVNLGIAVASPTGLIVPVIKNAENLSVVEISKAATPLFDKAREGKLAPDEYSGGTFTISNLGMFGIENFTAIINPPEVGILAVSGTSDKPVVVTNAEGKKEIAIRPIMNITLTVDHRLIDGLLAAQFVGEIKRLLENPIELLI
jgi:pyruvate dehydrogenase E2 component (dihydrolipoamide acetyltransferase)